MQISTKILGIFSLFLVPGLAPACENPPDLTGQDYHQARLAMIRAGWMPAPDGSIYQAAAAWAERAARSGNGRAFAPFMYLEMLECAPTGAAACLFRYQKGHHLAAVATAGEEGPGHPAKVAGVRVFCGK